MSAVSTDSEPTNHLRIIVSALQVANRRGVFELDESANVQEAIKFFGVENESRSDEDQRKNLQQLVGMCEVAQKRGAFNLAEASTIYPHVKFFVREPEQPVETESQSCDKSECDPENCPCDPENCPCDENKNCKTEQCDTDKSVPKEGVTQTMEKVTKGVDKEPNWDNYSC